MSQEIFVFGSNLAGRHGKGAAKAAAEQFGAVYGQGVGRQGNSYAIPTKDKYLHTLPLHTIAGYVRDFLDYARAHPELQFNVTRVGCGLAGYSDAHIAPMFRDAPENCKLDSRWDKVHRIMNLLGHSDGVWCNGQHKTL